MSNNMTPGDGFSMNVLIDRDSLITMHAFENYKSILEPSLEKAMTSGISMIQAYATDFMYANFRHPTGAMEEAWEADMQGPYLAILTNTSPYGRRRNYGFSNMTDALGRYYAHDPGIGWAEITVNNELFKVGEIFQAAIDFTNSQLGRGTP